MDNYSVKVSGLEGVEAKLDALGAKVARSAIRKAAVAGASVLEAAAKSYAPVIAKASPQREPGELRDAIDTFTRVSTEHGTVTCKIGPGYDKKSGREEEDPGVWGKFVELGTSKAAPEPYLRPAFDAHKEEALATVVETLRDEIGL